MQRIHTSGATALALAAALLVGCGSYGVGDILGGGGGNDYPQNTVAEVRGTVRGVDTSSGDCAIELTESTYDSRLRDDSGSGLGGEVVFCDERTEVVFEGRAYRPDALERGDRIVAQVRQVGNRLLADRIEVTYDVTDNRYDDDDRYEDDRSDPAVYGDLRGTVYRLDTTRGTIELERVQVYDRTLDLDRDEDRVTLLYDRDTLVRFEGQSYGPENLERGDVIEVQVDRVRGGLLADEISVLQDAAARY